MVHNVRMSLLSVAQRLGHHAWFAGFSRTCLVPIDRMIARATRGRVVTAGLLPGLMLTTTGRRSGQPRTQPLACFPDGDGYIIIGSNWGQAHHPAWSANLLANPQAWVTVKGIGFPVRAELATGTERDRLWAIALRTWPAYDSYQRRAGKRRIRVFRLTRIDAPDA